MTYRRQPVKTTSAGVALALLLAQGCATAPPDPAVTTPSIAAPNAPAQTPSLATPDTPPQTVPSVAGPRKGFNGTDVAWLQLTIAMDEQALLLFDLATEHATEHATERAADPAIRRLAVRLREEHATGLVKLRRARDRAGLDATNPHEGHLMPGMVTAANLATLRKATGTTFDRLFLKALRDHLAQTALLAGSARKAGQGVRTLAKAVERERRHATTLLPG
ncbi:DUF305 domain-containing protein [Streptosporangium soli]|nr:DUF305 domain-containing protein [Streptosporangium sp. KLBMP 9127]